jgi:hypothetical protein
MGRILIDIEGDQVRVHRPDASAVPEELMRRAAETGALSAGAAPAAPGRAGVKPAQAIFDAGSPPRTRPTTRAASTRSKTAKTAARASEPRRRSR